jgi:hypothetical protein
MDPEGFAPLPNLPSGSARAGVAVRGEPQREPEP